MNSRYVVAKDGQRLIGGALLSTTKRAKRGDVE